MLLAAFRTNVLAAPRAVSMFWRIDSNAPRAFSAAVLKNSVTPCSKSRESSIPFISASSSVVEMVSPMLLNVSVVFVSKSEKNPCTVSQKSPILVPASSKLVTRSLTNPITSERTSAMTLTLGTRSFTIHSIPVAIAAIMSSMYGSIASTMGSTIS